MDQLGKRQLCTHKNLSLGFSTLTSEAGHGAGEMAQRVLSSIPSNHMVAHMIVIMSSGARFWPADINGG